MNMRSIFFDFRGTLCREGYFGATLATLGAFCALLFTSVLVSFNVQNIGINDFSNRLLFTAALAVLWALTAITTKRLRDIGLSVWLQVPAWMVNCLPLIFANKLSAVVAWVISIAIFIALSSIPSKTEA